jgi:hypothetical protein
MYCIYRYKYIVNDINKFIFYIYKKFYDYKRIQLHNMYLYVYMYIHNIYIYVYIHNIYICIYWDMLGIPSNVGMLDFDHKFSSRSSQWARTWSLELSIYGDFKWRSHPSCSAMLRGFVVWTETFLSPNLLVDCDAYCHGWPITVVKRVKTY